MSSTRRTTGAPSDWALLGRPPSRDAFRVLFVCSANLCRSVTAAEYARRAAHALGSPSIEWQIESAGTDVAAGDVLPPEVARAMRELGIPPRTKPLPLTEAHARNADVILTAERSHRAMVARRFPFAVRYTFTLIQFARLLEAGRNIAPLAEPGSADLHQLARLGRSRIQPVDDATIDIPDPVSARSASAMLACAKTIESAMAQIVF